MEIWRRMIYQGEDYGDYYLVSNNGNVKNAKTGKIRKPVIGTTGYYIFSATFGSRKTKKTIRVHRAVAESFIENNYRKPQINHIDGNKLNNSVENLEYVTEKENSVHAIKNGLVALGPSRARAKLGIDDVREIRNIYENDRKNFNSTALSIKYEISVEGIMRAAKRKTYTNID